MYKACGIVAGSIVFEIILVAGIPMVRVIDGGEVKMYTQEEIKKIGDKLNGKGEDHE